MKRKGSEYFILGLIRLATYFIVVIVGFILFDILLKGYPVLTWDFIAGMPRQGGAEGGILPAIIGTICLVTGAMTISFPLGMASAIYLSEYARGSRFKIGVRQAVSTLAGVPSIVFGLFGLGLFVLFFGFGASILAGSLTLAFMILPTIIVSSEEALTAVPQAMREGSLALGASKWQTISRNVLPYALPGMLTGSILGVGRAAGETAPILLTVAAFYLPKLPHSIYDPVMALPYHLYVLATQRPDTGKVLPMQYGTALVLVGLVIFFNLFAIILRNQFRRRIQW